MQALGAHEKAFDEHRKFLKSTEGSHGKCNLALTIIRAMDFLLVKDTNNIRI